MRRLRRWGIRWGTLAVVAGIGLGPAAVSGSGFARELSASRDPCGLAQATLCETFSRPEGTPGTRSGQLSELWGVSRIASADNPSQNEHDEWAGAYLGARDDSTSGSTICGAIRPVYADNDVKICDGQLVESANDNGGQVVLAMYPRQPFDFAGRTGTVAFDVSDNTQGEHAAWPAFAITDAPVPAPYSQASAIEDNARDSVGFTLDGVCGPGGCGPSDGVTATGHNYPPGVNLDAPSFRCVTVGRVYETVNHQLRDLPLNVDGCVLPSRRLGSDQRFEVKINARGIKVYGGDPGRPRTLRLIANANFHPPLTRGLIWLEDVHYNANKFNTQQSNSFSWTKVGFDGPVLARDLGFDVPDNHARAGSPDNRAGVAENGLATQNLGYDIPYHGSLRIRVRSVHRLANAVGALLVFNYYPESAQTLVVAINGHPPLRLASPAARAYSAQTASLVVPLRELHDGTNTLVFSDPEDTDDAGIDVANIDLIARGAGGQP